MPPPASPSRTAGRPDRAGAEEQLAALRAELRALDHAAPPGAPEGPGPSGLTDADAATVRSIRERLGLHQQRERELVALHETVQDITTLRDVDETLRTIVRRARGLMGTDIAYLSVFDPECDEFYVRATDGTVSERFRHIRVERYAGICGDVAIAKRPYYSSSYLSDSRFGHGASIDDAVADEKVESILGVPLLVDQEVTGVLFVADRYNRAYEPPQVALLSSLAGTAAIAIENARLFEANEAALERERVSHTMLQSSASEVMAAADAHDQFASLIARGGHLGDLADVIVAELGGSVVIVDGDAREICRRGDDADAPGPPLARGATRAALVASRRAGRSVAFDGDPFCRVAAAVGAGVLQGGVVLRTPQPLSEARVRTLERSAVIAALVLLAEDRVRVAAHRAMTDLVAELVSGALGDRNALAHEVAHRGIRLADGIAVMAVDAPGIRPSAASGRLIDALGATPALVGQYAGDLLVLVQQDQPDRVASILRAAVDTGTNVGTVAYATGVHDFEQIPAAYDMARRCLGLHLTLGRAGTVTSEHELGPYAQLFSGHDRDALRAYVDRLIGPLIAQDRARSTALADTLLTYLDHGRDARTSAEALHLHANTLRQRLRTITRLLPDWNDPRFALETHMALRLQALLDATTTA
jgi:uncharacterized protein YigA (DUF484 family)